MRNIEINRIVITGRLYNEIKNFIEDNNNTIIRAKEFMFLSEEEVTKEVLEWADAYVAFRPTPNFDFHNLKWVHALGAGVDSFLFKRQWTEEVVLTRTICSFGRKISEYCLSYILSELQQHKNFEEQQNKKVWLPIEPKQLESQKVMIFGTGVIGQELAKSLSFWGVEITGVSLSGKLKEHFNKVIKFADIIDELDGMSWIINTMPLTEKTEGILGDNVFSLVKHCGFINVGRGRTVDEGVLIRALDNENLKVAVLDVFQQEPLPTESLLWKHSKVKITPHISAITSVEEAVKCFIDTLCAIDRGGSQLGNIVDIKRGY